MNNNSKGMSRRQFLRTGTTAGTLAAGTFIGLNPPQVGAAIPPAAHPATQASDTPWAMGNQLQEIRDRGKIIIASTFTIPPEAYHDTTTGEPAGYAIEVGKLIATDLEVEVEWLEMEFAAIIPGLLAGQMDTALLGLANRPQRHLSIQFTKGYVPYDQVLLIQADQEDIPWQQFNEEGRRITAQIGATAEFRAREAFPLAEIVPLDLQEQMLEVAAGRADATLTELYIALPFAANHPTTKVLMDPVSGQPQAVAREWGCIPVRPGEHAFMHWLDNWLSWYWDHGTLQASYDKIIGPALAGDTYWQ